MTKPEIVEKNKIELLNKRPAHIGMSNENVNCKITQKHAKIQPTIKNSKSKKAKVPS